MSSQLTCFSQPPQGFQFKLQLLDLCRTRLISIIVRSLMVNLKQIWAILLGCLSMRRPSISSDSIILMPNFLPRGLQLLHYLVSLPHVVASTAHLAAALQVGVARVVSTTVEPRLVLQRLSYLFTC